MALTLEVTGRALREQLGEDAVIQFGREGGTIGRAEGNDWRLPDSERVISSHHATIDFQAGSYYLIDLSTNGVYVNGSDVPVGRGKPQRLFDGDLLRMGEYVVSVTIDEGLDLLLEEDHRSSIARRELVLMEEEESDDVSLIDPDEMTGTRQLDSRLLEEKDAPPGGSERPRTRTVRAPATEDNVTPIRPSVASRWPASGRTGDGSRATEKGASLPNDAVEAFLGGLGIDRAALGGADNRRVLHNAGLALREFVLGTMELLQNRAAVMNSYRLEADADESAAGNPLQHSSGTDDALRMLLTGSRANYGPAVHSVRGAIRDLKEHQIAVVCAMRDALGSFTGRLDPDELEQKFDGTLKRNALFSGNTRGKYWDLYRELYLALNRQDETRLPHQFSEEFAHAYGEHIERLHRDALRQRQGSRPRDGAGS
ncbi:MAG: type VI secretion system-associated FHA domain protein TagH [Gammaproteobacteria bacterium]